MTIKRSKAFAALDLVLPVAAHYRTDPQVLKDIEKMRTNAATRWAKYELSHSPSGHLNNNDNLSKIATLARPKLEILRANSPTLKRLVAARNKLEKYATSVIRTNSTSRLSARSSRETPYPVDDEKQSSVLSKPLHEKQTPKLSKSVYTTASIVAQLPHQEKILKSQSSLDHGPLDKITYEKTWTRSGSMKQKCSLEIWLPKPILDDDDPNTSPTVTPRVKQTEKLSQTMPIVKSRRSSAAQITAASVISNIEEKSFEEVSPKKSEPPVVPRVYHYGDYIMDIVEERPRSSKSVTTVKSDGTASIKSLRRQHTRPHTGRQSTSTNHSEEILRFGTVEVPTSAKKSSAHTKSVSSNNEIKPPSKPCNSSMINELMQKYSLIKKNHQELTQAKLQLEKPNHDGKSLSHLNKENLTRPRPPPVPESTSLVSSDQPSVSVKKLLLDTPHSRSAHDHNYSNQKLLERRSTPRKQIQPEVYPQLRIFSLANQQHNRQSSASAATTAYLPTVNGKKQDDSMRILQRNKTLDVVLDLSNPIGASARASNHTDNSSSNRIHCQTNAFSESAPTHIPSRSVNNLYSEQRKQQQIKSSIIKNANPTFSRSPPSTKMTNISANKVLVHFNHSNNGTMDHGFLIPE